MNTKELYAAQLNVSKLINDENIQDLISRLSMIGNSNYNHYRRCIDISINNEFISQDNDESIRNIFKEWLFNMNLDTQTYSIFSNNLKYLINITKISYPNIKNHVIHVYLS